MKKSTITFFFYMLAFILSLESMSYAYRGVLDLRLERLESPYALSGEWEIYWKQLISPGRAIRNKQFVDFPKQWKGLIVGDDTLTSRGYATYRLKVLLPENPSDYELLINDMYNSYTLMVNGKEVAKNGVVAANKENSIPLWKPTVVTLRQLSGPIEIILQISNWRHSKGGSVDPIFISKTGVLSQFFNQTSLFQLILFIASVVLSIFFLYRFAFISYDYASLFFSLFLLNYAYRLIGTDLYPLHRWIESYPWKIAIHLEYLTLYSSVIFFSYFVHHLYPGAVSKMMIKTLLIISLTFILGVLVFPPYFFTSILPAYLLILILYIIYGFYVYTNAVIDNSKGSLLGIISTSVVFIIIIYKIFNYFDWMQYDFPVMYYAHLIFLLLQSLQVYLRSLSKQLTPID